MECLLYTRPIFSAMVIDQAYEQVNAVIKDKGGAVVSQIIAHYEE